jgi:threonine dehydrogenase-like Zn-dependent dehydrogenase
LPPSVSLELGALIEPLAVGWHAVSLSEIKAGESALVLGGGPIGLSVIQALKARNVSPIIVSEVATKRKLFASSFGAHHVLDPTKDDIVKTCKEICDGQGVHYVFDAAGVQAAIEPACHAMRVRGTMVNIAIWEDTMTIKPNAWVFKERKWIASATYAAGDFQEVIDAIDSGKLKPADMITLKIKMDEVEDKGFRNLVENKNEHVKILVEID